MIRRIAAVSLVSTFLLAGCGAQKAALTSAPAPTKRAPIAAGIIANNAARLAPTVGVIRGQAAVEGAPELVSTLRVLGRHNMADEELAEDAESQGYSLFAASDKASKPFNKTGFVRRTETGFMMEGKKGGFFSKKEKDNFVLVAGTTAITSQLNTRVDKKALIKGIVDKDNVVTVTSVKGLADLGFLTNWFTKGKIAGTVTDSVTDKPLEGVDVLCKSEDGFLFKAVSDEDGEFEVKSLTPGNYFLTLSKDGYKGVASPANDPEVVGKRERVEYTAELAPVPAAD